MVLPSQVSHTMEHDGWVRSWIVYAPPGNPPAEGFPVIVALHGFTQTAQVMMMGSGLNALANEEGFLVVYPQGVNNAWNTQTGLPGGSAADDTGFIGRLLDTLPTLYPTDTTRTYACGFSNGGYMTYELACRLGSRFAAVGSVAGTMTINSFDACQPSVPIPLMHIHGTADFVVNINGGFGSKSAGEVLAFWQDHNGLPTQAFTQMLPDLVQEGSTVELNIWGPGPDSVEIRFLRIIGGGHTWPGYTGAFGIGNVNQDIRAEEMLWQFFRRFRRPQSPVSLSGRDMTENPLFYPNPATDHIFFPPPAPYRVRLVNALAETILESNGERIMAVGHLPSGLYFLCFSGPDGGGKDTWQPVILHRR